MSAVHVTQESRIVAVSHLIGLDQLPKLDSAAKDNLMDMVWKSLADPEILEGWGGDIKLSGHPFMIFVDRGGWA